MLTQRLFVGLIALAAIGQGCSDSHPTGYDPGDSAELRTEVRPARAFDSILAEGGGRLIIEQTGFESLTITAPEGVLEQLTSEVEGGRLELGPRPGVQLDRHAPITYRVTVTDLRSIRVAGGFHVEGTRLESDRLAVSVAGAGEVTLSGSVHTLEVSVAGAGGFSGGNLASRIAEVDLAGAGRAVVRVAERLSGSLAGASRLEYLGNPAVTVRSSGTSSIVKR